MGIFEAYDRDAFVAVLRDGDGNITEGAGFNVFAVKNNVLFTPQSGVFEGMTRRTVLELCEQLQLRCEVRPVAIGEVLGADEIFMTSTAGGIMPVTTIDGNAVRDGKPGPLSRSHRCIGVFHPHAAPRFCRKDKRLAQWQKTERRPILRARYAAFIKALARYRVRASY